MKQQTDGAVLEETDIAEQVVETSGRTKAPLIATPRMEDVSGHKPIVLRFKVEKDCIRQVTIPSKGNRRPIRIHHIYPNLLHWVGRALPDGVNPRSHEQDCLKSAVAKDIHATLLNQPEDLVLANRGLTIIAEAVTYDQRTQMCEIRINNVLMQGVADGATSDAVISQFQTEIAREITGDKKAMFADIVEGVMKGEIDEDKIPNSLRDARVTLQVFEKLDDHDRVAMLAQGRNRSRQVKDWSMANFRGEFDWLMKILEADKSPFKGKIGYEENASQYLTVLDVLAILTLIHPEFNEEDDQGLKAPVIAYASKGRIDKRLGDDKLRKGYLRLAPLVEDILTLWEYIYSHFEEQYNVAFGKAARLGSREGVTPTDPENPIVLPLTEQTSNYELPAGYIYPLLAAFRALVIFGNGNANAKWAVQPFEFWDKHGSKLIKELMAQVKAEGGNPNSVGKKRLAYTAIYDKASLALSRAR